MVQTSQGKQNAFVKFEERVAAESMKKDKNFITIDGTTIKVFIIPNHLCSDCRILEVLKIYLFNRLDGLTGLDQRSFLTAYWVRIFASLRSFFGNGD